MKFFDTHAHIGLIYDDPIEQLRVIQQAKQAGVVRIVSINNSLYDFNKIILVLSQFLEFTMQLVLRHLKLQIQEQTGLIQSKSLFLCQM